MIKLFLIALKCALKRIIYRFQCVVPLQCQPKTGERKPCLIELTLGKDGNSLAPIP